MDEHIIEKLQKVLALTTSPMEGEAQAAAYKLSELLTKHNLSIADLETRGKSASQVKEDSHDLGKAAFTWKLNLAEGIAKYYYCHPMVDRKEKTVRFVGRPDNVESLKMLYSWLIDQVRRISSDERKKWIGDTGEHVDPLRWQVNFGLGAASRLSDRLREKAEQDRENSTDVRALVIHHDTEISDYTEKMYGYRTDGKETQSHREWRERYEQRNREAEELKARDIEEYYRRFPWERPLTEEEKREADKLEAARRKEADRKDRARERRQERNGYHYHYRIPSAEEMRKSSQARQAKASGHRSGDRINLEPFVEGGKTRTGIGG